MIHDQDRRLLAAAAKHYDHLVDALTGELLAARDFFLRGDLPFHYSRKQIVVFTRVERRKGENKPKDYYTNILESLKVTTSVLTMAANSSVRLKNPSTHFLPQVPHHVNDYL